MAESIRETLVQYPSDKVTMRAYVAAPQTKERRPAIIVIQEWWGLTEHIKDVARRFAAEGYVAIAPDLYSRLGYALTTDPGEAGTLMNTLQQEDGLKDLHATVVFLKSVPEADAIRIGVTGFCMGGSYALMLPCVNKDIKAAVPFYGQVPNPDAPLQQLSAPVLYFYGEDDGWITKVDVQRLAAGFKKYNKSGEIKTYPGAPHAFFRDTDKTVYRLEAAKDAWARATAFFQTASEIVSGITGTMPLDAELGKKMLQLITSRYDDRHWRKKIEKTLSLPQSGVGDPAQQQIFMYLKIGLKAYKSRRADPDSWIVGGYATKEIVERAKFQSQLVGPDITKDDVAFLGSDPGKEIDEAWWDEMLVSWFDVPEEEKPAESEGESATDSESASSAKAEKA